RLLVVAALKEPEETAVLLVHAVMLVVQNRRQTADDGLSAPGDKCLNLGDLLERMVLPAQQLLLVLLQRGNPIGIVPVQIPGQVEEVLAIAAGPDRRYHHVCHVSCP